MLQSLGVLPQVLVVEAKREVGAEVIGFGCQDRLKDLVRSLEPVLPTLLAVHVHVCQAEVEARGNPAGCEPHYRLEGFGRLSVLILLHEPPAAVELGQHFHIVFRWALFGFSPSTTGENTDENRNQYGRYQSSHSSLLLAMRMARVVFSVS
jgi:hypothetical protein